MGVRFSFEGNPVYQEAMAFAYACMRRAQAFPAPYRVYGDELRRRALTVCEEVAIAFERAENTKRPPEFGEARAEAIACTPIIDLATSAGILRETERESLRQRLEKVMQGMQHHGRGLVRTVKAPPETRQEHLDDLTQDVEQLKST